MKNAPFVQTTTTTVTSTFVMIVTTTSKTYGQTNLHRGGTNVQA